MRSTHRGPVTAPPVVWRLNRPGAKQGISRPGHRSAPVRVPFWVGVGAGELEPVALVERRPLGVNLG
jgi:hypothetical protein